MRLPSPCSISVIIPTHNRSKLIADTINSFFNQDYPNFEVIVCDNNSTDDTHKILLEYQQHQPFKLLFESRQGAHFARNSAAKSAQGDILYFTDDDMIATPNLLSELAKAFHMDERIASATGRVLPKWEASPPPWVEKLLFNGLLSLNNPNVDLIISEDDCNIWSCHLAVLRQVFFEVGGFNPDNVQGNWIGDGETGLNIKIKGRGYKFACIGSSIIYHRIPASRMTQKYLNWRLKNQGNCDAYTKLKRDQGSISYIKEIKRELFSFWWKAKNYVRQSKIERDYLRFIPAELYYTIAKLAYYRKALNDSDFMAMVLREDWLNEKE